MLPELRAAEIYSVDGSLCSRRIPILATASFDNTVRIWDVMRDTCVCSIEAFLSRLSVNFSPDGDFLASGSSDQTFSYGPSAGTGPDVQGRSGIFEVSWNYAGDKIAACFSDAHSASLFKRSG